MIIGLITFATQDLKTPLVNGLGQGLMPGFRGSAH